MQRREGLLLVWIEARRVGGDGRSQDAASPWGLRRLSRDRDCGQATDRERYDLIDRRERVFLWVLGVWAVGGELGPYYLVSDGHSIFYSHATSIAGGAHSYLGRLRTDGTHLRRILISNPNIAMLALAP